MKYQQYLEENLPRYLNLLHKWVDTNSFTANPEGVNSLAKLTAAAFFDLGFEAEYIPSENPDFGNHLVLTRKGTSDRKLGLISFLTGRSLFSASRITSLVGSRSMRANSK